MSNSGNNIAVHEKWTYRLAHGMLLYLVALVLTVPVFMMVFPFVPVLYLPIGDGMRIDHLLTFVGVILIFLIVVRKLQFWIYGLLVIALMAITITGLVGGYGFKDLYSDYQGFVLSLKPGAMGKLAAKDRLGVFQDSAELEQAMDFAHPDVRNYAVKAAIRNFQGIAENESEQTLIHSLSVFKEINSKWKYVADPLGEEYIAKASESLQHFSGDCDDHTVLMAACIHAIGGRVRMVRTKQHIYPELFIGDSLAMAKAADLIRNKLFRSSARGKDLYHHTEDGQEIWLNLDYTRKYPGGEVMDGPVVGILDPGLPR